MLVFLAVSGPALAAFERDILLGEVDSDEGYTDRIATTTFELRDLIHQVVNDSINLLDHGFRKNLRFGPDFDGRNRAARHQHSFFGHRDRRGNEFAESSVSAAVA